MKQRRIVNCLADVRIEDHDHESSSKCYVQPNVGKGRSSSSISVPAIAARISSDEPWMSIEGGGAVQARNDMVCVKLEGIMARYDRFA